MQRGAIVTIKKFGQKNKAGVEQKLVCKSTPFFDMGGDIQKRVKVHVIEYLNNIRN
jgi:hypothetical protein